MPCIEHQEGNSNGGDLGGWTGCAERDAAHLGQNLTDRVSPCPYRSHDLRDQQGHCVHKDNGSGPVLG